MANPKAEYEVEIKNTGTGAAQAKRDLEGIDKAAGAASKTVDGLRQVFVALGGVAVLRESLQAFIAQTAALERLRSISGATEEQLGELHQVAEKLSTLMGRDLNRAVLALGQALSGDFDMFKQLGFAIDETLGPTEQFNNLLDQIITRFENRELSKPMLAEVERMQKSINDLKVAIGSMVAAGIQGVTTLGSAIGATLGGTPESLANQRANAGQFITRQQGRGLIDAKVADELRKQLQGPAHVRTPDEEQAAITAVMARLGASLGGGAGTERPAAPGVRAPNISTPSLGLAEAKRADDQAALQTVNQFAAMQARQEEAGRWALQHEAAMRQAAQERRSLEQQATLERLEGEEKIAAEIEINHDNRVAHIQTIKGLSDEEYETLLDIEQQRAEAERKRFQQSLSFSSRLRADMAQTALAAQQAFAQGLAGALVDAFEQGDKAFQSFARNFLRTMSQMILQAIIFRAVQAGVGALFSGGGGGGSNANAATDNFELSAATKLSSLAPRRLSVGEFSASIAPSRIPSFAPASAGGAAGARGSGGHTVVHVMMEPGLRGGIVKEAVDGATVKVTNDMGRNSKVSRATKRIVT